MINLRVTINKQIKIIKILSNINNILRIFNSIFFPNCGFFFYFTFTSKIETCILQQRPLINNNKVLIQFINY